MSNATRGTIRIESVEKGVFLDVWYYRPLTVLPHHVVVAGPGMTVTKDAGFAPLGEAWVTEGYASLMFDFRTFGASDGQPRDVVDLRKQVEDYGSVIDWARQFPDKFLSDKIVLLGSAMSGLAVATIITENNLNDFRVAGAMFQSPLLDGYATLLNQSPNLHILFWAFVDLICSKLGVSPVYVKACGRPNEAAFINAPSVHDGFKLLNSENSSRMTFAERPNRLAPRLLFDLLFSRPGLKLEESKCPILIVIGKHDDLIPVEITRRLVASAYRKVEVTYVEVDGGHFDVVKGGACYKDNIDAQLSFLKKLY